TLMKKLGDHRAELARTIADQFGAEPAGKPSSEPESDLDLNVKGDDAGTKAVRIKGYLDQLHPGWERRYRMAVMIEAARTSRISDAIARLPPATRKDIAQRQALTAEALQLMRQARSAGNPAERAEILSRIADTKLRSEAETYANLDAAMTRQMHDRLLADTDRRLAAVDTGAPDPHRVEEALVTQMWANGLDPEAYVSPGAIQTVVLGKNLEPGQAYEAVIDQVGMIHHQVTEAGGMRAALRRYETFKYVQRICDHLLASGMHDPRITFLRNQAELVYNVERRATASAAGRTLDPADLTKSAFGRSVRYEELGPTPGVSDAVLAETHAMLAGLLNEQLPILRKIAVGPNAVGGPPPVNLPPLGPDIPPTGTVPAHAVPPEKGLASPDALERIADSALHGHAPPAGAGASVKAQADAFYAVLANELTSLGTKPPHVEVHDLQDPLSLGRYDVVRNVIVVNEGAAIHGKRAFDGSPLGQQRLRNTLLHEACHAEQFFQALRHRSLTERDPAKLARETGAHPDIIAAALKQPALDPQSREGAMAKQFHDEIFGRHASRTAYGQDIAKWTELAKGIRRAETEAHVAQVLLTRLRWYELWKLLEKSRLKGRLAKAQSDLTEFQRELDDRRAIYESLLHEQDALKTERLAAQLLGEKELAVAARRHANAKTELEFLQSAVSGSEHQAEVEALTTSLQAYSEVLERVGANFRELGIKAPPKGWP
ncbi:MAG: hypothetical protein QOI98_3208, partial [Solirubrobacteraceae bacterium]|nr:hypothetical protein [Solirubrobacteraceae bacterium]